MAHSKNTKTISLSFAPLAQAAMQLMAELDGCSVSALVTRLLREEMARRAPGAWEAGALRPVTGTPEEKVTEVLLVLRERMRAPAQGRSARIAQEVSDELVSLRRARDEG